MGNRYYGRLYFDRDTKLLKAGVFYNPKTKKHSDMQWPIQFSLDYYIDLNGESFDAMEAIKGQNQMSIKASGSNLKVHQSDVSFDWDWEENIMDAFLIKEKALARHEKLLDAELEKPEPSQLEAIRHMRQIDRIKKADLNDEKFWAQKALEGLDERVQAGEKDKETIRVKLTEKLK